VRRVDSPRKRPHAQRGISRWPLTLHQGARACERHFRPDRTRQPKYLTQDLYAHLMPGMGREAVDMFEEVLGAR